MLASSPDYSIYTPPDNKLFSELPSHDQFSGPISISNAYIALYRPNAQSIACREQYHCGLEKPTEEISYDSQIYEVWSCYQFDLFPRQVRMCIPVIEKPAFL
jgi:hypothetical protein